MANMTLEEALAAADVNTTPVNDILMVDAEARTIIVPASEMLFGVRQDMDAERKHFKCPKIVGDNVDLSNCHIYISYVPSKQDGTYDINEDVGAYLCEDLDVDGDYVTFSWKLSGNVFVKAGYIAFAVYAKHADADGNLQTKWHTTFAIGKVLDTLPDGEQIVEKYADVIEQLLNKMENVEKVATHEAMQNYVEAYLAENPPSGMTDEEREQLQKNTEDISSLSDEIKAIKENGTGSGTGWNTTQINLLETIGYYLAFTDQKTGQTLFNSLIASLRNSTTSDGNEEPENPDATLTGITAEYTGGDVVVGTSVTELKGITVTATYSDGSVINVTGYALFGEIVEGENTITVSYGGLETTFTVTGVTETSGEVTPTTYTITNSLINVSTDNTAESVGAGTSYTATLTGNDGYNVDSTSVFITMGGIDVTSSVYIDGVVTIPEVTGNVIIVASGVSTLVYALAEATTFDGTNYIDTGYVLNDVDKDWSVLVEFEPTSNVNNAAVFSSDKNANCYGPRLAFSSGRGGYIFSVGDQYARLNYTGYTTKTKAVITHKKDSGEFKTYAINTNVSFMSETIATYSAYATNGHTIGNTLSLTLGKYAHADSNYFTGTIHRFEVYEEIVSSDVINDFIGATWVEPSEPVNLIDFESATLGGTAPNGQAYSTDYYVTDFIPVTSGNRYKINITKYIDDSSTASPDQRIYVYDSDKKYLNNYYSLSYNSAMGTYNDVSNALIGVAYVKMYIHTNYKDVAFFGEGTV